jgi:hypothetical protein
MGLARGVADGPTRKEGGGGRGEGEGDEGGGGTREPR